MGRKESNQTNKQSIKEQLQILFPAATLCKQFRLRLGPDI